MTEPSGYSKFLQQMIIPTGKKAFFAMGDNSTDSLDGRAWGFVPENEIIGRAFLVYYPFTKRWGFAE